MLEFPNYTKWAIPETVACIVASVFILSQKVVTDIRN